MSERLFPKQGLYHGSDEHDACGIGFAAHIKGLKSHAIIQRGLEILERMEHRGGAGADEKSGDGSGIMLQIPHDFYKQTIPSLPESGEYGSGLVFLPVNADERAYCQKEFERVLAEEKQKIIAWRDVPVNHAVIGKTARESEPFIRQVFVTGSSAQDRAALEKRLYISRKRIEKRIRASNLQQAHFFYIPSLSGRTIVYKGMLTSPQLREYYDDLRDERVTSAMALVHSRFSTNTLPSWDLAQPFRLMAHNGEINTIKGNRFRMADRESQFESDIWGADLPKILPVIEPDKSDSASLDNALEMLAATGRSLPHALMMLIPESWNEKNPIPEDLKYFYEYHSTIMEAWDGPAAIVFCDGRFIGGTLDRNGLRPSRYTITGDDVIVMASETGVQTFDPEKTVCKGRLMPGKLLLIDTEKGCILPDEDVKKEICHRRPYQQWVETNRLNLADIPLKRPVSVAIDAARLHKLHLLHGYTQEDIDRVLIPMMTSGMEPVGSMGADTPPAVFSQRPQLLFNYFKQNFAQVTNPSIDSIRENLVMSLTSYIGQQRNLLAETPQHCKMIKIRRPVLSNSDVEKIKNLDDPEFRAATFDTTFKAAEGSAALETALEKLCRAVEAKIDAGAAFIILSDCGGSKESAPIPCLLACSGVHHHLIRVKKRTRASLIVETAEAREVMHFALLFGCGAGAVNPYGAFATIAALLETNEKTRELNYLQAEDNFIAAIDKGLLKVMAKMGTSTLRSYRGAQLFEALGLSEALVQRYFSGTASRIGGIGLKEIARETLGFHAGAWQAQPPAKLENEGIYSYKKHGESHAWNPETISLLQQAVRSGSYATYREFSSAVQHYNRKPHVIRGLFDFNFKTEAPIAVDEVEPLESILGRMITGAMSFGSISPEAHEAIAVAMNAIGGKSNCGEGGENPERFKPRPDGSSARSAIKQVASGRFGVTANYLINADEIQIKISQGAKPGEGGQLPGHKIDRIIAETRHSTPGVTLISPPPHHDIYSIEDLAQLIFDLKNVNPNSRISVKLVAESGVGTVAAGVAKALADTIVISGFDGGTGASPLSSIRHAGMPWEMGLAETHQTLIISDLRGRVKLQTDGQLKTGYDIVLAALLGAEEFAFGTAALIALGCVMVRRCHLNTCPVGIATQDPQLRKRFKGEPEHLINYFTFMAREVREIMARLGIRRFDDLVGRTDLLRVRKIDHWKAKTLDPSPLLHRPPQAANNATRCIRRRPHGIGDVLDKKLIEQTKAALDHRQAVTMHLPIANTDRATGAMLSGAIASRYGEEGLPDDTIRCTFSGSAGQSFGAFLTRGITFRLEGDANDYFGKGLCGGRLIAVPPPNSAFTPTENVIAGNTVLYGATAGEVFIRGIAGERFGVRNSGAIAVVEGAGDHCAEYMTGGRLIVLGSVGRNFGAGMSGGIAYVLNIEGNFQYLCNKGMVELTPITDAGDQTFIKKWLKRHIHHTESRVAMDILNNWHIYMPKFIKIMPFEYKRVLQEMKLKQIEAQLRDVRKKEQIEIS